MTIPQNNYRFQIILIMILFLLSYLRFLVYLTLRSLFGREVSALRHLNSLVFIKIFIQLFSHDNPMFNHLSNTQQINIIIILNLENIYNKASSNYFVNNPHILKRCHYWFIHKSSIHRIYSSKINRVSIKQI
jgi:hypothetical protein